MPGAMALQSVISSLRNGMELADAEISKYLAEEVSYGYSIPYVSLSSDSYCCRSALKKDADNVHVSAQSLSQEQSRYLVKAERHLDRLKKSLVPNYARRIRIREEMDENRYNNP